MRARAIPIIAAALLAPVAGDSRASAHEVLHEVVPGRAVAVHVFESDGDPLAGDDYQVFSPSDPGAPYQTGRTDRAGWLAFVPDAPGAWRVRVLEPGGHGLDAVIDTAALGAAVSGGASRFGGVLFVLRPALGVALIALVFGALALLARRKRRSL